MDTNFTLSTSEVESRSLITKVYLWMSAGLALTGWIAAMVSSSPELLKMLVLNRVVFYGLIIGEFALVIALSAAIHRMTSGAAILAFLFYAAFNGVTLSTIFLIYTAESIASTFFITAGTFGLMSFYGYVTKKDLTTIGNLCFMALIGIILASIVNLFLRNETLMWVTTYIGVFIFVGLIAYDTQKIKNIASQGMDEEAFSKVSIMGALALYLDFVNLFLHLLRIAGKRR